MASLQLIDTNIMGVYQIKPFSVTDQRGKVVKEYDKKALESKGIIFTPCESLIIESKKGVLRGLHFQFGEKQDKIVRCISGEVWAVIVDLRTNSSTLGQWLNIDINNASEVYVPGGCAFGTLAMTDSYILCMFGEAYDAAKDSGIWWNDETIGVKWPMDAVSDIIVSEKDNSLMSYNDYLVRIELK